MQHHFVSIVPHRSCSHHTLPVLRILVLHRSSQPHMRCSCCLLLQSKDCTVRVAVRRLQPGHKLCACAAECAVQRAVVQQAAPVGVLRATDAPQPVSRALGLTIVYAYALLYFHFILMYL